MFVGQSGGKAKGGGMPQREQKAVLAAFRKGEFNTLVATCIGEEGLDIPQARTSAGFDLGPDSVRPIPFSHIKAGMRPQPFSQNILSLVYCQVRRVAGFS